MTGVAAGPTASTMTANGTGATKAAAPRARRPSQLSKSAIALPTVENSLEEFIAKANQTLVDVGTWDKAEQEAKQEDSVRREMDAQRMKATEYQMREGEAREASLRRQLDGLQGKLAEAEARAAVAADFGSGSDPAISSLRAQVQSAEAKVREAELRATVMSNELVAARAVTPLPIGRGEIGDDEADERVRLAEAKATKALAAARAAAAGLTISPADLAAIESGLVVTERPKKTPWALIGVAFLGGLAIMFAVYKLVLAKPDAAPGAAQPAAAAPAGPSQPVVTPIEDPAAAKPAAKEPVVTPIEPKAEEPKAEVKAEPKVEPKAEVKVEPKVEPKAEVKAKAEPKPKAEVKTEPKPKAEVKTEPKVTKPGIADPFADPPAAPAKKPPATKPAKEKPASTIVDPF